MRLRMQDILPRLGWAYLLLLSGFAGGVSTMHFETWPYSVLSRVNSFLKGDPHEQSTLSAKLAGEFGQDMARRISTDWSVGVDRSLLREFECHDLKEPTKPPLIYTGARTSSYPKALMTQFLFDAAPLSVVLLDAQGAARHRWDIHGKYFQIDENGAGPFFHGDFVILDDGSIITFVSNRNGLLRINLDGRLLWRTDGFFHHHMSLSEDGHVWVWGHVGPFETDEMRLKWNSIELLHKVEVTTGEVVKTIRLVDVMEQNLPRMDPMLSEQVRKVAQPSGLLAEDVWHPNDVDVLTADIAGAFPQFAAGDLAVSLRHINLVFVMDPETLNIKWWSQGAVQVAHDPDWQRDGTLTILNNRSPRNAADDSHHHFSAIQRFDFQNPLPRRWIEGVDYRFTTATSGWHDVSPDGFVLISSTRQGRIFEIAPNGEISMEFVHRIDGKRAIKAGSARYVNPQILERTQ